MVFSVGADPGTGPVAVRVEACGLPWSAVTHPVRSAIMHHAAACRRRRCFGARARSPHTRSSRKRNMRRSHVPFRHERVVASRPPGSVRSDSNSTVSASPISPSRSLKIRSARSTRTPRRTSKRGRSAVACTGRPRSGCTLSSKAWPKWIRPHCLAQYVPCCRAETRSVWSSPTSRGAGGGGARAPRQRQGDPQPSLSGAGGPVRRGPASPARKPPAAGKRWPAAGLPRARRPAPRNHDRR